MKHLVTGWLSLIALALVASPTPRLGAQGTTNPSFHTVLINGRLLSAGTVNPSGSVTGNYGDLYLFRDSSSSHLGSLWVKTNFDAGTSGWSKVTSDNSCDTDSAGNLACISGTFSNGSAGFVTTDILNLTSASSHLDVFKSTGARTGTRTLSINLNDTSPTVSFGGTSGGLPCYSAASTLTFSAALGANLPLIGGGAGACVGAGTRSGNTTEYASVTGATSSGDTAMWDASGNVVDSGKKGRLTVTTGSILGGTVSGCISSTVTVAGATTGMGVQVNPTGDASNSGSASVAPWGYVSSSNTVTIKLCGNGGTATAETYVVNVFP